MMDIAERVTGRSSFLIDSTKCSQFSAATNLAKSWILAAEMANSLYFRSRLHKQMNKELSEASKYGTGYDNMPGVLRLFYPLYRKLIPDYWVSLLKSELTTCNSVLDLGCGYNSPIQHCNVPFSVGVELFDPYLQESKRRAIHNEYIKANIMKVELKPKCFDAVVAIEVLEHLTKEEGYTLIERMERWSRKKVVVTTPNGYLPQDSYDK
jgi:hypothetical protein